MKKKRVLMFAMALTISATNVVPSIQAFAAPASTEISTQKSAQIQPRFKYTSTAELTLNVSSSGADYNLYISGISEVTKITGVVTLYKKNSLGAYKKIDSADIAQYSDTINLYSTLSVDGPGIYKITFKGKVYGPSGYDSISLKVNDSY